MKHSLGPQFDFFIDTDFSKHDAHNFFRYDNLFAAWGGLLILKIKFFLKLPMIFKRNRIDE
ncbi:MAG TPA: hypothetical protein DCY53_04560 [Desulfobacteraceae bacterium]|nr:hypothetical protein [Desulfobacteraceae bacterium]